MTQAIVIGMLGAALFCNTVKAQTAVEQAQILRDFDGSLVAFTARPHCLMMLPEAITAATPAPQIFTLPVAMVFRQLIARAVAAGEGGAVSSGVPTAHRASILQPFPATELVEFPKVLHEALPSLPTPLEYRLIGNDLVIRDANADVIVAVLRNALSGTLTRENR